MKKILLLLTIIVTMVGCDSTDTSEQSRYHKDGRAKPKVAFLPVIDSTDSSLPWSLAQEFTEGLEGRFLRQSNLFLLHDYNVSRWKKGNPMQSEEGALFQEIRNSAEFVVIIEIAEHSLVPKITESLFNVKNAPSYHLSMSIRVKVVDLRNETPKTILQEMFTETHTIPWQLSSIDYSKTSWGKTGYFISPLGLAHAGLMKRISGQIEDYILLAKTR